MAEGSAEATTDKRYLDRYEVVAVALPGAAAILFLWYLHPEILGTTKFELKDVSVGTLGIFAIAALIVGQVVQAVANLLEELLNSLADLWGKSPAASLPPHGERKFVEAVRAMGVANPDAIDRRRYRKELNKDIIGIARRRDTAGMLQVFNVSYGLNRGLAIATGAATIVAAQEARLSTTIVFLLLCAAMTYRTVRFSRRYEGELLRRFLDDYDDKIKAT